MYAMHMMMIQGTFIPGVTTLRELNFVKHYVKPWTCVTVRRIFKDQKYAFS